MKAAALQHVRSNNRAGEHSIIKTIGAVIAGLVTWIFVATVINLPLRAGWPHYHDAETALNFTLGMKLARLVLGALSSLCGGFVAGWITRGRTVAATALGIVLLTVFVPNHYLLWAKFPVWYHLAFLVPLAPLVALGASLPTRIKNQTASA